MPSTELSRRFEVPGAVLAWDAFGPPAASAAPLVLVHGFSGSSFDFAGVIPALSVDRPVLVLDQRGHGGSSKLGATEGAYSIEVLRDDLVAWLQAVTGGDPVHLLGHSMGGRVVMETAIARPDLVRSLVLMDTSAGGFRAPDEATEQMVGAFLAAFDPSGGLPDLTTMRGPEDELIEAALPPAWREARDAQWRRFDPYALAVLGRELRRLAERPLYAALGTLSCPATVIVGERDLPLVEEAPRISAAIPGAELVVLPGAYHSPQLTHAAAWVAAVESHLARAEATS
ncbi:MAG TPA: alpha/beta hydrolase [Acidimicrobiales bacterium]|nr:alpha/beta hydrolase [Acidimicrobiales bacterium]